MSHFTDHIGHGGGGGGILQPGMSGGSPGGEPGTEILFNGTGHPNRSSGKELT